MKKILTTWAEAEWPFVNSTQPLATGDGLIDSSGFATIEVDKLFTAINHAQTLTGQAVLYRSLNQPLTQLDAIQQKQEAVAEIRANAQLKTALETIVQNAANHEKDFFLLLFGDYKGTLGTMHDGHEIEGYGYALYRKAMHFMITWVNAAQTLEQPNSVYLQQLLARVTHFTQTRSYELMKGPVFVTENGLQSKTERQGRFSPAVLFVPKIIKPLLIAATFALYWLLTAVVPVDMQPEIPNEAIFLTPFLLLYFPLVGGFDRDNCINPLRKIYKECQDVADVLDVLGQLDELLAFISVAEKSAHNMVLPHFINADRHQMHLEEAKNPVLSQHDAHYVGNDLHLQNEKLVLITGPNSGGKTALSKTITQIQLLAQIGCYVPARSVSLTVADHIFYQVPEISHLEDGEGRFGTELKRTKAIFLATTAKSLVVLDEMSEGTTFEEKMESSHNVLNGFYRKGNSTILITHNHQLVDLLVKEGTGDPKQVEFANEAPTYKLIAGISRVSHADRVAKKIGFSKEDIEHYLEESK
ncbi:MAG: MutS-related protein [Methylovulum sp.]|jgi:DNA mismatch repair protein MutS